MSAWILVARLDFGCQIGRQLGLLCQPRPQSPIPRFQHIYIVKVSLEFYLILEGYHRRIVYICGGLALQKLGRKRERWATQLSRTPSKASARDERAAQYSLWKLCHNLVLSRWQSVVGVVQPNPEKRKRDGKVGNSRLYNGDGSVEREYFLDSVILRGKLLPSTSVGRRAWLLQSCQVAEIDDQTTK
jgi:hypothetical protein